MSPEQARGDTVDHRTDLWSLGVVLYEMVTGRLPFRGEHEMAILYSVVNTEPQPLQESVPDASPELIHIIGRALEKEPFERYQSASDMLIDLRRLKKDTSKTGYQPVSGKAKKLQNRRNRLVVFVGIFVLLCLVGYFLFFNKPAPTVSNRLAVTIFENKTGDTTLNGLGTLITETLTQGLSEIKSIEVVPSDVAIRSWQVLKSQSKNVETDYLLKSFADHFEAKLIVTGAYYKEGNSLQIRANVTDIMSGKLLRTVGPISGSLTPDIVIEQLRQRLMGGIATLFDRLFVYYKDITNYTPTYESYKDFQTGVGLWAYSNWNGVIKHLCDAIKKDSTIYYYLVWQYWASRNAQNHSQADSLFQVIQGLRQRLIRAELLMVEQYEVGWKGNIAAKLPPLRELFIIFPEFWGLDLGSTALALNRLHEALNAFSKWDQYDSSKTIVGLSFYWGQFTLTYHLLGRHDEELQQAEKGIAQYPHLLSTVFNKMRALIALGQITEVWKMYDEACTMPLQKDFTQGDLIISCASELRVHGYIDASRQAAEKGIMWYTSKTDSEQQQTNYRYGLANAYYIAEQWNDAKTIYQELVKKYPESIVTLGYLGTIAARLGDSTEARRIIGALKNMSRPYVFGNHTYWQACIASILGENDKAVVLLREALGQGQSYSRLHRDMDLEPLKDYPPFQELIKPKD